MTAFHVLAGGQETSEPIGIRKISTGDLLDSLRRGFADFMAKPSHYAFVVVIYPIIGFALFIWVSQGNALQLIYPLVTGFALLGPFAALGLYEISRRLEAGMDASWHHAFEVLRSPALPSIAAVGTLLLAIFVAWMMTAQLIYELTLGTTEHESLGALLAEAFGTSRGLALIFVGNIVGALFALLVLCTTVVAFPLLLDRDVGALAAVVASARAVRRNPGPMILWGVLVGGLLFAGALPFLVGLIVVLPVLGHATWHLYRKVVVADGSERRKPAQG